ncbi:MULTISPECIES: GrpB family protein [Microbacterium]|uniref:GrpB family protein n=1 Tax=Microbacterium TaxID=33882 RepID=UPI0027845145|nr:MULTISPECIES: GrpB family protein [Microbacterium]MDQ1074728.1 GrpB-like predicted nucleotidyltransferase (UPF0157 family) [Microbacterium sp. SORGH_AS_0969]MDQ1114953.1 GrpB-like predicted nucleotidyltransferase (UPF0157 family) [Microbacterium testaceum]
MSDDGNPAARVLHRRDWAIDATAILTEIRTSLASVEGFEGAAFDRIGSTAIPGLAAKPNIDLQVRILPLPVEDELLARLEPHGFVRARGLRPDSPGVDRDLPRGQTDVDRAGWEKRLYWHEDARAILRVRRLDSPWGQYTVWFRDWLRAHPVERDRYIRVEEVLGAEQVGKTDYDDYTRAKTAFFDEVQADFEGWAANSE